MAATRDVVSQQGDDDRADDYVERSARRRHATKAAVIGVAALAAALASQMWPSGDEPGAAEVEDERIVLTSPQAGNGPFLVFTSPMVVGLEGDITDCGKVTGAEGFAFVRDPSAYVCYLEDRPYEGNRTVLRLVPVAAKVAVDAKSIDLNALRRRGLPYMSIRCDISDATRNDVATRGPDDIGVRNVEGTRTLDDGSTEVTRKVGDTYVRLRKPVDEALFFSWGTYAEGDKVPWTCDTSTLEESEVNDPESALEHLSKII